MCVQACSCLTTQCCHKTLSLACQRSKDKVSAGEGYSGDGGAKAGHQEVCHSQVQQDKVEVRPQLLVLGRARNCQHVDADAPDGYKWHKCRQSIEQATGPQVVLGDKKWAEGGDVVCFQWNGDPEVLRKLHGAAVFHSALHIHMKKILKKSKFLAHVMDNRASLPVGLSEAVQGSGQVYIYRAFWLKTKLTKWIIDWFHSMMNVLIVLMGVRYHLMLGRLGGIHAMTVNHDGRYSKQPPRRLASCCGFIFIASVSFR